MSSQWKLGTAIPVTVTSLFIENQVYVALESIIVDTRSIEADAMIFFPGLKVVFFIVLFSFQSDVLTLSIYTPHRHIKFRCGVVLCV